MRLEEFSVACGTKTQQQLFRLTLTLICRLLPFVIYHNPHNLVKLLAIKDVSKILEPQFPNQVSGLILSPYRDVIWCHLNATVSEWSQLNNGSGNSYGAIWKQAITGAWQCWLRSVSPYGVSKLVISYMISYAVRMLYLCMINVKGNGNKEYFCICFRSN